jgi:hypothetical protein
MQKILPVLFFGLGALQGAGLLVAGGAELLGMTLPMALLGLVGLVGFGLAYMLMFKARPSPALGVIGILQWLVAGLAAAMHAVQIGLQKTVFSDGTSISDASQQIGLMGAASSVVSLFAGLLFISALAVAINTRPPQASAFS